MAWTGAKSRSVHTKSVGGWIIQRTVRSIGFNVPLALFDRVLCRVGFSESRANSQLLVTFPNVWDPDIQRISINDNVIFYQSPFTFKN